MNIEIHGLSDSTIETLRSQLGDMESIFARDLPKSLSNATDVERNIRKSGAGELIDVDSRVRLGAGVGEEGAIILEPVWLRHGRPPAGHQHMTGNPCAVDRGQRPTRDSWAMMPGWVACRRTTCIGCGSGLGGRDNRSHRGSRRPRTQNAHCGSDIRDREV